MVASFFDRIDTTPPLGVCENSCAENSSSGPDGRALPALQRFDCSRRAAGRAKTTVAPTATHGGGPPSTGIGNRLQDGLEDQQSSDTLTLYGKAADSRRGGGG